MSTARDRRRAWVSSYLADARPRGTWPTYGSPEWHGLAPTDPLRWAAVIVAAECWADECDPDWIAARAHQQIDAARELETEDARWFADTAADVRSRAGQPTHVELQRRRGDITEEQAIEQERMWADFVAGRTDIRPSL